MTVRVVATAGHVDHGKSTLVRALTGTDPDRFEEEKRRGLTIDLGFARLSTSAGAEIDIIDVPGHVRFIKNMLAGVGAIDACLFVVASTEGWKPQTEEHLRILELLGVRHGVVALTMAGLADTDDLELVRMEVEERTNGTFLDGAKIVTVDAVVGIGLADLRHALEELVLAMPPREDRYRPRLWVDRSFAISGAGTVVTGTLAGGGVSVGEEVEVVTAAGARPARIRGLQAFGEDQQTLPPGCRAAVNLAGLGHRQVGRGDAVVRPGQWHRTRLIDASLRVLPSFPRRVRSGGAHLAYLGCGEHPVRLRLIGTQSLGPGEEGLVRVTLPLELPLTPGDRFVLRDSGSATTVGGGEVLDVDPILRPSRARPNRSVDRVIEERGWVDVDDLERLTGVRREAVVDHWVVDPGVLRDARDELRARVAAAGPLGLDVAAVNLRDRAVLDADDELAAVAGRATTATSEDPYSLHPYLAALADNPFAPPSPESVGVDRGVLRELVRRGMAVEADGIVFSPLAVDQAVSVVAGLLRSAPEGFTVADFRLALSTTRRFALPLLGLLDQDGVTRRRGDLRTAGPRLARYAPGE